VGLAAVGLLLIMVAALAGVVTMLAAGVIKPAEAYEAVQWDIIFLLAGVIPLGNAMAETGGATFSARSSSRVRTSCRRSAFSACSTC